MAASKLSLNEQHPENYEHNSLCLLYSFLFLFHQHTAFCSYFISGWFDNGLFPENQIKNVSILRLMSWPQNLGLCKTGFLTFILK